MRYVFTMVTAMLALAFVTTAQPVNAQSMEGYIRKVDVNAGSFQLGGKNERNTSFRFGVRKGEWEAAFYLDGKKTSAQNGFPAKSKATVAYKKIDGVLWATKVEVTSPKK